VLHLLFKNKKIMTQKEHKQHLLDQLYEPYKKCLLCPLATPTRKSVVFGEGNADAQCMIIGEAPGKDEDEQGVPFIGKSGRFLTKILTELGINRKDIFITNSVKCRPPNNRKPTDLESKTCKDILLINQIKIIQPKAICTLGSAATESLLEMPIKMGKIHGTMLHFGEIPLFPTYHPAYIMRNPKKRDQFIRDLQKFFSLFRF
jgi:uracil-DNA glycosylase